MSDKEPPVGVSRPRIDYVATGQANCDLADDEVVADHPPEHVLETLRTWVNFE